MSKKHYKAIAQILSVIKVESMDLLDPERAIVAGAIIEDVAASLANYFGKDNERFNKDKFLEAVNG